MNYRNSIIGSSIAFILATSCCWLPALIVALGGGTALLGLSQGLEKLSGPLLIVGVGFLSYGLYRFKLPKTNASNKEVILQSTITCPQCGFQKEETMPTNACQYFYECDSCNSIIKPLKSDCCVFCSYGTVACPPIQLDENCC